MKNFRIRLLAVIFLSLLFNSSARGEATLIKTEAQVVLQTDAYEIIGDRKGQVTVKNRTSGQIMRTFQMPEGVVRELFLLNGSQIVGASQKDRAIFWNLKTGQTISQFPQRIYGFTHDEKKFFTYHPGTVLLYNYSKMALACKLDRVGIPGPDEFAFSPNDRFLAVVFISGRPESDEYFSGTGPSLRAIGYSKLFDINHCQEIKEFSKLRIRRLGKFSKDSRFYDVENYPLALGSERRYVRANWRFDLTTNKLQQL